MSKRPTSFYSDTGDLEEAAREAAAIVTIDSDRLTIAQQERWREVINTDPTTVERGEMDTITPGFLILVLDGDDANGHGIYECLVVAPHGGIAQYTVNLPRYFRTFWELLEEEGNTEGRTRAS